MSLNRDDQSLLKGLEFLSMEKSKPAPFIFAGRIIVIFKGLCESLFLIR